MPLRLLGTLLLAVLGVVAAGVVRHDSPFAADDLGEPVTSAAAAHSPLHRHRAAARSAHASAAPRTSTTSGTPTGSSGTAASTPAPSPQTVPPAAVAPTSPQPAGTAVPAATASASGLGWNSGAFVPGSDPARYRNFADWRGRPLDVVVDWPARQSWSDIVDPSWLYRAWAGTPYTKVFGVGMIPEDGSATLSACAEGRYDSYWRQFGTNISAAGLAGTTIIRLGWEFDTPTYIWSARDPQAYAGCWQRVVSAVRTTAPALRWDWTVNRGPSSVLPDPRAAYPGDAYVDVVGVDSYDVWPAVHTEADWTTQYSGPFGLKFWADFAASHGKQLSVPEWGVVSGAFAAGHNGGDNPFYVQHMVQFFRSLGPALAYESYFDESGSTCGCAILSSTLNPRAAEAYRAAYAAG